MFIRDSFFEDAGGSGGFEKPIVSRSAVAEIVAEDEERLLNSILADISFGYDLKMIKGKIKQGSYSGSSLETLRSYKRHFG